MSLLLGSFSLYFFLNFFFSVNTIIIPNMALPGLHHRKLNATFKGIQRDDEDTPVHQFRGIKYASIPGRFEKALRVDNFEGRIIDASKYGYVLRSNVARHNYCHYSQCPNLLLCRPRCPQADVDVKHLLRIPEDFTIAPELEDEFECLNLEITCPPVSSESGPLPVLVWIHGLNDSNLV